MLFTFGACGMNCSVPWLIPCISETVLPVLAQAVEEGHEIWITAPPLVSTAQATAASPPAITYAVDSSDGRLPFPKRSPAGASVILDIDSEASLQRVIDAIVALRKQGVQRISLLDKEAE